MGNQQIKSRSRKSRSAPNSARNSSRSGSTDPLTPYQATALKETWHKMCKSGRNGFGSVAFKNTIEDPTVRKMYQQVDVIEGAFSFGLTGASCQLHEHSVSVNKLVEQAVSNSDNLTDSDFIKECEDIGAQHSQFSVYGFKSEFWDVFGNCLLDTAMPQCRGKCALEKRKAWAVLASIMADRLRAGYESSMRRKSLDLLGPQPQRIPRRPSIEDSLSVIVEVPSRRHSAVHPDVTNATDFRRNSQDRRTADNGNGDTDIHRDHQFESGFTRATRERSHHHVSDRTNQNADQTKASHTVSSPLPNESSVSNASAHSNNVPLHFIAQDSNDSGESISCGEGTPDLRRKAIRRISLRGLERANRFRQKARSGRRMTAAGILDTTSSETGSSISTSHLLASTDRSMCQSSLSKDA